MPQPLSNIDICNRALARIGAAPIMSLDDDTDLSRQVEAVFDDVVESCFAAWRWRWAAMTHALQQIDGTPLNGWAYAYAVPAAALGEPLRVMADPRRTDAPLRAFQCEGRQVFADHQPLWGVFITRHAPDLWPPLFRAGVVTWLAAHLAVPVTHDSGLAETLRQEAVGSPAEGMRGGLIGRAIALDAAAATTAPLGADDPLTGAQFAAGGPLSGPWHGSW